MTYIDALAYELGEEEHDLDELTSVLEGVRASLRDAGIARYRTTTRSPVELAREPLARTLAALGEERVASVRRLIFATNSVWDESMASPHALSRLLAELELPSVFPVGVFMSWCANFQTALQMARALIEANGEECVLVVCTDVWPPERDRLVSPQISVHSDAAVAFAVTADEGSLRVLETRLRVDSALGGLDRAREFVQYMDGVARNVVGLVDATLGAAGVSRDEIAHVLPNNYNRWVCRSMAGLAGFDEGRLYLDNVPRFAHALACDNPINLADLVRDGRASVGDRIALMGSGAYQWGCSLIEVAGDRGAAPR